MGEVKGSGHSTDRRADEERLEAWTCGDPAFDTLDAELRRLGTHLDKLRDEIGGGEAEAALHRLGLLDLVIDRTRRFVHDLAWLQQLEERRESPRRVHIDRVLDEALESLSAEIEEADALVLREELPAVWARQRDLVDILREVVGNALRYRGDEPLVIRIAGERDGDWWVITVEDNGRGFDPDLVDVLFDTGVTLEGSGQAAGAGVGLAACRMLLERNYGSIQASASPGDGARFSIRLHGGAPATAAS